MKRKNNYKTIKNKMSKQVHVLKYSIQKSIDQFLFLYCIYLFYNGLDFLKIIVVVKFQKFQSHYYEI